MAQALFTNNAFSLLASGITDVATSLTVTGGDGALFPNPTGGDYFYATLIDTSNNLEIVQCTARSTDTLTIVRGAESTTGLAYSAGDRVELRVTAAGLGETVTAAAASAAAAASDAVDTAADLVLTNADVVSTNADVTSTNADVVSTNADVVLTGLDVVSTGNDVTAAGVSETNAAASAAAAAASAAGIFWKEPVLNATTANIALSGEQTIDGILTSTSRILVKDQTASEENGIYVTAGGAWARATPLDTWDEHVGAAVIVSQGTTQEDTAFLCTADAGGTLETTAITWTAFASAGLLAVNNLSDVGSATTSATNLGLGTGDSPQFTGIELGHASDSTITRVSAGLLAVEGDNIATMAADQTFTGDQTFGPITETQTTKATSFTPSLTAEGTVYNCNAAITITMPTPTAGKGFTIIHDDGTEITWAGTILWAGGAAPTAAAAKEIYVFLSDGTNWYGNLAGTGYA
jgi:hypothetical protein